jgi:hypothetical protein
MKFTKLFPNIFYANIQIGIQLFVDCLPNLWEVQLRPSGAKEFALANPSGVCVVIQQWGK